MLMYCLATSFQLYYFFLYKFIVKIDVGRGCRQLVARQKPLDHSGRLLVHGQFHLGSFYNLEELFSHSLML